MSVTVPDDSSLAALSIQWDGWPGWARRLAVRGSWASREPRTLSTQPPYWVRSTRRCCARRHCLHSIAAKLPQVSGEPQNLP